ncbi:methyltransferase domain-containing protein [Niallia oryzisoli]|uniref:Methyltransferase domain-containing protein n=1 Tax=Niallia oryzisoli TaxID=1737571 RepID=A0ABZ2C768_9BACI
MDAKKKWNEKYKEKLLKSEEPILNVRLQELSNYLNGGTALDLACGLGGNSTFLANLGYRVEAVDISEVAIEYLQLLSDQKQLSIHPRISDLTDWQSLDFLENSFDLVVITYYLDRSIFPLVESILKENGYFFMETFYLSPKSEQKVSSQYKLKSNELLSEFGDWHVLYYEENELEGRQTIFCRKKHKE